MEKFIIRVVDCGDGYTYSLPPEISRELKSKYPDSIYPTRIFIGDFVKGGEESQRHVWSILVGMLAGGKLDPDTPVEFLFQDTDNTYTLEKQTGD